MPIYILKRAIYPGMVSGETAESQTNSGISGFYTEYEKVLKADTNKILSGRLLFSDSPVSF